MYNIGGRGNLMLLVVDLSNWWRIFCSSYTMASSARQRGSLL